MFYFNKDYLKVGRFILDLYSYKYIYIYIFT